MPIPIEVVATPVLKGSYVERVSADKCNRALEYLRNVEGHDEPHDMPTLALTSGSYATQEKLLRAWKNGATLVDGEYVRRTHLRRPHARSKLSGDFERAYYERGISLSCMRRDVRGWLADDLYVDVDMVRAHPLLLASYCKRHGIEAPTLLKYAESYEEMEAAWAMTTGAPVDAVKRLPTVLLNGGSFACWMNQFHPDCTEMPSEDVGGLNKDRNAIFASMATDAGSLVDAVILSKKEKSKSRAPASPEKWAFEQASGKYGETRRKLALSLLAQNLERRCIEYVYGKAFSAKERKTLIYCFDGFMVPKALMDGARLERINALCGKVCPARGQKFRTKAFNLTLAPSLTTIFEQSNMSAPPTDLAAFVDGDGEPVALDWHRFDVAAACRLATYAARKKYWEHFHCKIYRSNIIASVTMMADANGELQRELCKKPAADVSKTYPVFMKDLENQEKETGVPTSFFGHWNARDPQIRAFDTNNWIPFDGVYSNKQHGAYKHMFNEFLGYSEHIVAGAPTATDKVNFQNWLKITREVFGGPEPFGIGMQLLAHKVKAPHVNIPYSLIIRSRQGEGKDTLVKALSAVVGRHHVLSMQQMDGLKQLGGTGALAEKLFVQINECDRSQMAGMTGTMKALTSDDWIQVRKLYENPKMSKVYGLFIFTTNGQHAISVDMDSGERRYFVFLGTGRFAAQGSSKPLDSRVWAALHNGGLETPGFVRLVYDYMTTIYDPDYDFHAAKKRNEKTPAYQRMMGAQRKEELFWLQALLESSEHVSAASATNRNLKGADKDLVNSGGLLCGDAVFHEHVSWKQMINVSLKELHTRFRNWGSMNSLQRAKNRMLTDFISNLTQNLNLPFEVIKCKVGSDSLVRFTPQQLYFTMFKNYLLVPKTEVVAELQALAAATSDVTDLAEVEPVAFDDPMLTEE